MSTPAIFCTVLESEEPLLLYGSSFKMCTGVVGQVPIFRMSCCLIFFFGDGKNGSDRRSP